MKKSILFSAVILSAVAALAQPNNTKYPEPEFSKEVYYLKKDSVHTAIRLEKNSSKMETKTKMGGMGGYENGYSMEGSKSTARLPSGNNLSFVFSKGSSVKQSSPETDTDSIMQANGMDPDMMSGSMMDDMNDPASSIILYKVESEKGKRKILMQKSGIGSKKIKSSDKYSFSVKKIRAGYWELVIDKPLPRGEYAFTMMGAMGMASMDGSTTIFAFAID